MIWLIGPGDVALLLGLISPRLMGLSQIDLGTGLGIGALFAALSLGVLLAAGLTYRRTRHSGSPYASLGQAVGATVRLVLEAGSLQWHWAFYRSAIIVAAAGMGLNNPVYWGAWLAVGWICLEGTLVPSCGVIFVPPAGRDTDASGGLTLRYDCRLPAQSEFLAGLGFHALIVVIVEPRLRRSGRDLRSPTKKALGSRIAAKSLSDGSSHL